MSLIKCRRCGEMFSDSYKTCPFCEEDDAYYNGRVKKRRSRREDTSRRRAPSILGPVMVLVLILLALLVVWLVYDYSIHNRTDETVEVRPTKVVIVEGILIFQNKALRDLLDIKIFVETDADVRILRRALRDVEERGRSLESVVNQYLTTVKPMHEQFVEPTRKFADIIVLEGGHNLVALDMIMQRIASHIRES